eukprot:CAMPEP_0206260016 /NCGR_PEP_ID=MMETSP0047_2-20121206/26839_1 /ASSEMBLY_ACC=CAM_ASM_000192 /TAXON_ID=195065 /ORGANISM="Chroomonas mesostigmatica_cf, Strain CCMP1168" /LENGTH=295 /DNA_ID=CAMNT_0053687021 /DNA_START=37 /DNA_END=924 /DNA_ORIENTATION=-
MSPTNRTATAAPRVFGSVRFVREDGSQYTTESGRGGIAMTGAYVFGDCPAIRVSPARRDVSMDGDISSNVIKRNQSPVLKRDSLASRYSPVRAGSRRRQRWERERDMLRGQALTEEEVKALYQVTSHSAFADLFEDGGLMERWSNFCSQAEETQEEMARPVERRINVPKQTTDPSELYTRMSSRARGMLERGVGVSFLEAFEAALVGQVYGDDFFMVASPDQDWDLESTQGGAKVTLQESLSRLVCHAICVFYSLSSFSVQDGGAKTMLISWPQPPPPKPASTLTEYLKLVTQEA